MWGVMERGGHFGLCDQVKSPHSHPHTHVLRSTDLCVFGWRGQADSCVTQTSWDAGCWLLVMSFGVLFADNNELVFGWVFYTTTIIIAIFSLKILPASASINLRQGLLVFSLLFSVFLYRYRLSFCWGEGRAMVQVVIQVFCSQLYQSTALCTWGSVFPRVHQFDCSQSCPWLSA